MKAQTYNPYKAKTWPIDRFRGIVNPENQQTIAKEYVGSSDNAESFKLGELNQRIGQERDPVGSEWPVLTGSAMTTLYGLAAGSDVFVDQISDRFIRTKEIDFPRRIPITNYNPILAKTCGELWELYPEYSEYERADAEETNAYAETAEITETCWAFPGTPPTNLPELPGPEKVVAPDIDPIIPDWDFGGAPTDPDDGDGRNPCAIQSISPDVQELQMVTEVGGEAGYTDITITVTGKGSGFYGVMKPPVFNNKLFSGHHSSVVTRDSANNTSRITATYQIRQNTALQTEAGVYKGAMKICFEICGKEYCRCVRLTGTMSPKVRIIENPGAEYVSIGGGSSRTTWYRKPLGSSIMVAERVDETSSNVSVTVQDAARPSGSSGEFGFVVAAGGDGYVILCPGEGLGHNPITETGPFPGSCSQTSTPTIRYLASGTSASRQILGPPPDISEFPTGGVGDEDEGGDGPTGSGYVRAAAADPPWYTGVTRGAGGATKLTTFVLAPEEKGGDYVCV